ncbi:transposable element Tcb1 transposase [Trichonephila clavipes]|uniref:Transposable element Tcb1 transposase n=1 Tax=Trichonephila clavipes TaxID=2585209 RepID=A0A8X6WK88_TRICX|nr:transposable element Tcb1 transposase [Trichonephila clavipes]
MVKWQNGRMVRQRERQKAEMLIAGYSKQPSSHRSSREVDRWMRGRRPLTLPQGVLPQNWSEARQIVLSPVWCSKPRLTTGVHLTLHRYEFYGLRFDTARHVALAKTYARRIPESTQKAKPHTHGQIHVVWCPWLRRTATKCKHSRNPLKGYLLGFDLSWRAVYPLLKYDWRPKKIFWSDDQAMRRATVKQHTTQMNQGATNSVFQTTVQRSLLRLVLRSRRLVHAPMLTASHQQRRMEFSYRYRNWASNERRQVEFSD